MTSKNTFTIRALLALALGAMVFFSCTKEAEGPVEIGEGDASKWLRVAAGSNYTCGINGVGRLFCWGESDSISGANLSGKFRELNVSTLGDVCALKKSGDVVCWGQGLGPISGDFIQISAGNGLMCGVNRGGTIECSGTEVSDRNGIPDGTFSRVALGVFHSCALTNDGVIKCWGMNLEGQCDAPPGKFVDLDSAVGHSCALSREGQVDCWGNDAFGKSSPPSGKFTQVSAGGTHSCALKSDESIHCWGSNKWQESEAPEGKFRFVSAGARHSCAITLDGDIKCWGDCEQGQCTPP